MVKFTNKAKGRPSKRMTLKKKYKIQHKVKQHHRKMRRQAKKLKARGLNHSKHQQNQALPNMYPFKQDELNQYQSKLPQKPDEPVLQLPAQKFGLVIKSINTAYLPKTKDSLSKKYCTNLDKLLQKINVCLITLDAREPTLSRDSEIQKILKAKNIKVVFIVTKTDSVTPKKLQKIDTILKEEGVQFIHYTNENKSKTTSISHIINRIAKLQLTGNETIKTMGIVGKSFTGKSTIVKAFMKYLNVYSSINEFVLQISIQDNLKFIDSVYRIQDKTGYPLFHMPEGEQYRIAKQENLLKQLLTPVQNTHFSCPVLDQNQFTMHYEIQNFISIDDMLKKVGKAQRIFGKGGMVDVNKTRNRILIDWFNGKLNHLMSE